MAIVQCLQCGTQYDGSQLAAGSQFQCAQCGALVTAGAARPVPPQHAAQYQQAHHPQAQYPQAHYGNQPHAQAYAGAPAARRAVRPGTRGPAARAGGRPGAPRVGHDAQDREAMPPGYPAKKKSSTGLVIGIVAGVVVLLVLVIVIATAGGSSKHYEPAIQAILGFEPANPKDVAASDLTLAEEALAQDAVPKEKKALFENRLRAAKQHMDIVARNIKLKPFNEKILAAKNSCEEMAERFFNALKSGDLAAMRACVDEESYFNNIRGNGERSKKADAEGKTGEPWNAPSTCEFKLEKNPGSGKYSAKWERPFRRDELTGRGFEYLKGWYSHPKLEMDLEKVEGKITIYGAPRGMAEVHSGAPESPIYYAKLVFRADYSSGPRKELKVDIGGSWGSPAKVIMIYDDTIDAEQEKMRLAGRYSSTDPIKAPDDKATGSSEKIAPALPPEKPSASDPEEPTGEDPATVPDFPAIPKYQGEKPLFVNVKPVSPQLVAALDRLGRGNSAALSIPVLRSADDMEKARTIAACADILVFAARQGQRAEDESLPAVSEFLAGGLEGWVLPEDWMEWLKWDRMTKATEMAWRYKQAYDAALAHIGG